MTLRNLKNHPEKMIPVAMAMIAVGMSILVIGIAWPTFAPSTPHTGTNWNDFFRGFMYGLAIALEAGGVAIAAMAATAKKRNGL